MIARRTLALLALFASLALCGACQVGDPLVDRVRPPAKKAIEIPSCAMPEDCDNPITLNLSMPAPIRLEWQTCPVACTPLTGDPPTGGAGEDGAGTLPIDCVPLAPLEELNADLSCVTKRFSAGSGGPALAAGADVLAQEIHWQRSNIVIEADEPVAIVISNAEIEDTRIHLVGPVELRFEQESVLTTVHVSSTSGAASVMFDGVTPTDLAVGDGAESFAGHVAVRHSTLALASIVAESVELDSVAVEGAFISARDLIANDGSIRSATLDVGHATFAPATLNLVAFERCQTLSFFGAKLNGVLIPRCSGEPTRIYDTDVLYSRLDGRISGDSGKLEHVQLGVDEASEYELWAMTVAASAFCDNVEQIKVSPNAIRCTACSDAALEPLAEGCTLPDGDFEEVLAMAGENGEKLERRSNYCEPLDKLQACTGSEIRDRKVSSF